MRWGWVVGYGILGAVLVGTGAWRNALVYFSPLPREMRRDRHMDQYHRFEGKIDSFAILDLQVKQDLRSVAFENILPVLKHHSPTLEGYLDGVGEITSLDFRVDEGLKGKPFDLYDWWGASQDARLYVRDSFHIVFSSYELHTDPVQDETGFWIDVWSTQKF